MDADDRQRHRLRAAGTSQGPGRSGQWTPPAVEALSGVFPNLLILELIGQGGMGAVYKARQTHLDRVVALKLLAPHLTTQVDFASRFQREAMVLARLRHPHIVALYDVGEAGPWRYLVMEYIEGATLREVLTTGPFTAGAALTLAPQLCEALAYAHGQGIIHRDLKPENILIDASGKGHIADFGLATLRDADPELAITKTGDVLGTAAYMAPEQLSGASGIDHRADLYALGVIIYEMLTGHLPLGRFEVPSYQGRLDVRIDSVVLQALERTPELRWQSADDMRRAVDAIKPGAVPPRSADSPLKRMAALCVVMLVVGVVMGTVIPMAIARMRAPANASTVSGSAHGLLATSMPITITTPGVSSALDSSALPPPRRSALASPPAAGDVLVPGLAMNPSATAEAPVAIIATETPTVPAASASSTVTSAVPTTRPAPGSGPPQAQTPLPTGHPTGAVGSLPLPPLVAPTTAASVPAGGATPGNARHLVISGPGELTIDADPDVADLHDLHDDPALGLSCSTQGEHVLVLTLMLSQAHGHVHIPSRQLESLSYDGSGRLVVRGCAGEHLAVEHRGTGTLELENLALGTLELSDRSTYLTRVTGLTTTFTARLDPLPDNVPVPARSDVAGSSLGYVDAIHLVFSHCTAAVDGGACLRLAGHAEMVVASLGEGFIDASALSAAKAEVTVTGSGHALFGDLGALDAACTGNGTLHWTGYPVLGQILTH